METLSDTVRRIDEDRWLASRFASEPARARLTALYALNDEIARVGETVTQAALGDIRFAWWREAIAEIYDGGSPRAHPVLVEFAATLQQAPLPRDLIDTLVEARSGDLDTAAFPDWAALEAYVDATAGAVMRLAFICCGVAPGAHEALITPAARAWGLLSLARAGRTPPGGESTELMLERALAAHRLARVQSVRAPVGAFPAFGYVTLAPRYVRALRKGRRDVALIERQLRLIAASATGRI